MTIQEIKSLKANADIIKVIGSLIPLSQEGVNYVASCPFHNERSKSLMVSASKNIFKCFGCGKSGDVIDFVMSHKGMTYTQAIQWISDNQNIQVDANHVIEQFVEPEPSFMTQELMQSSMGYVNNFSKWLFSLYPVTPPLGHYIGSSKHWKGAVVFWYVDYQGRVRSGKIMQYDPETGKRVKVPKPLVTWVHRALRLRNYTFATCLFGEHLLKTRPNDPVCIVESEKSAIVASIAYPTNIWLASGSLTNLTYARCKVLEGRNVTLYPDVGAEDRWREKMLQLQELIPGRWRLSTINSNVKGYDICDMIVDNLV